MSYTLKNLRFFSYYVCSDEDWHSLLKEAQLRKWKPRGTLYDLVYQINDNCDDDDDVLHNLFQVLNLNHSFIEWDGNYTDKENQIVKSDDAYNLMLSLKGTFADPALLAFLGKGSFRICSL